MKIKQHRDILEGESIKSCAVSRKAGKYYISILVECEDPPAMKKAVDTARALGLDYSVPDFYVDSEGRKPEFPKTGRKAQKRLAKLQRRLSRKKKGSKNREKAKLLVQRLCQKMHNQRLDFCHKESRRLVDAYDIICLEDIDLRGMSRCLKLGKSVMDFMMRAADTVRHAMHPLEGALRPAWTAWRAVSHLSWHSVCSASSCSIRWKGAAGVWFMPADGIRPRKHASAAGM